MSNKTDREELTEILTDYSSLSHNEADHLAGMMISAGFQRPDVFPEGEKVEEKVILYVFDGVDYAPTEAGQHRLLEDIAEAITTEAASDTNDESGDKSYAAFANTDAFADFWMNIRTIMTDSPYEIKVERIFEHNASEDEKERATWAF